MAIREDRLADIAAGIAVNPRAGAVRFGELLDDVITDYKVNRLKSLSTMEHRIQKHVRPYFGHLRASTITTAALKTYIVNRQESDAQNATIKRELEVISRAFSLAIEGRKIMASPSIPTLKQNNVRKEFFTPDEVRRLVSALADPYNDFVLFGFLTGWRYSEVSSLEWRNVDFANDEIRLDVGTTKSDEGRVFPLMAELRTLLKRRFDAREARRKDLKVISPYVFAVGPRQKQVGEFRKSWKKGCKTAGLPHVTDATGKVVSTRHHFHDLRRTAAREFQRQGFTEGQIMRMCGWETDSMFRRYNIVTQDDIREKMRAIEAQHEASLKTKLTSS